MISNMFFMKHKLRNMNAFLKHFFKFFLVILYLKRKVDEGQSVSIYKQSENNCTIALHFMLPVEKKRLRTKEKSISITFSIVSGTNGVDKCENVCTNKSSFAFF